MHLPGALRPPGRVPSSLLHLAPARLPCCSAPAPGPLPNLTCWTRALCRSRRAQVVLQLLFGHLLLLTARWAMPPLRCAPASLPGRWPALMLCQSYLTVRPHGLEPTRLPCPWDSPGKNAGVGCRFLLQGIFPTQRLNPHLRWQAGSSTRATWELGPQERRMEGTMSGRRDERRITGNPPSWNVSVGRDLTPPPTLPAPHLPREYPRGEAKFQENHSQSHNETRTCSHTTCGPRHLPLQPPARAGSGSSK